MIQFNSLNKPALYFNQSQHSCCMIMINVSASVPGSRVSASASVSGLWSSIACLAVNNVGECPQGHHQCSEVCANAVCVCRSGKKELSVRVEPQPVPSNKSQSTRDQREQHRKRLNVLPKDSPPPPLPCVLEVPGGSPLQTTFQDKGVISFLSRPALCCLCLCLVFGFSIQDHTGPTLAGIACVRLSEGAPLHHSGLQPCIVSVSVRAIAMLMLLW